LSAAVMLRRGMRGTSIYFYLLVLAIVDTTVLYVSAFKTWVRVALKTRVRVVVVRVIWNTWLRVCWVRVAWKTLVRVMIRVAWNTWVRVCWVRVVWKTWVRVVIRVEHLGQGVLGPGGVELLGPGGPSGMQDVGPGGWVRVVLKTWVRVITGVEWLHASTAACRVLMFLLLVALHLSAWLIVVVSADRFVAVWMRSGLGPRCMAVSG